ncbi:RidA family protein [Halovulum dunhuangense]|uniref:RidA family protein n=1 Tax=Halovulum dunhuangense TaxID=1505036 RepID=A0A849L4D3_9RHOB|nr:RidA family protein [Halovulum dunhuangense]NNU81123.1 RidA family protein [Halovulum dunhuangense]
MKAHTPATIRPPFARYSHAVEVPAGHRLILLSGQLGIAPDDHIPEGAGAQADLCFANIDAILASAGADRDAIVRVNAYVTDRAHLADYMAARDRYLGQVTPPPASTLMIVSGFAREIFKVEIEVLAALPG